jgi:hypothetical protein
MSVLYRTELIFDWVKCLALLSWCVQDVHGAAVNTDDKEAQAGDMHCSQSKDNALTLLSPAVTICTTYFNNQ